MTWSKEGSIWVQCETIDAPQEPRTLKLGWTIKEVQGIGIFNPSVFWTPIQHLYVYLLKQGRQVLKCEREGNIIKVGIVKPGDQAETYYLEYKLEPKDE